ncbi:monocarboxylate transporter 9 [Protopterus annectens]|uniref:monocarboxylate transporter 9 n=1 Tax=Protopterus annectens TaxID=7888 RepID=UPI001CF930C7|nr:monocarboxylate transporter 9 [Protopterus annectens]
MTYSKNIDGGWGWMIVAASFMVHFLAYGSPLSVGVLYTEWLDAFGEGKGLTAWIGSLANGVGLIASPICSVCVSTFGARPVTVFSGVLVCGGMLLSAFASSVQFLILSYGIIVGLGAGLAYSATVTITCQYFDKRRGLALGLVTTGSSVGLFIYASLQKKLIEIYGLEGCLLIMSAISLHIVACGTVMRTVETPSHTGKEMATTDQYIPCSKKGTVNCENEELPENGYGQDKVFVEHTNHFKDKHNAVVNKLDFQHSEEFDAFTTRTTKYTYFVKQTAKNNWAACLNFIEISLDLFKNKVFTALFLAILLFDVGSFPSQIVMEDLARSCNIDEDSHSIPLVAIVGITSSMGKFVLGVLADVKWMNSLYLYTVTLIMMGATLTAVPFATSYVALAVLCGIIGFLLGNWSIFPYVTTKTVGVEKLTHAYGILMFFAGVGNALGPPVIGWFFDWTQTYHAAFYFGGACVLLGGFILLLSSPPFWSKILKTIPKSELAFTSYAVKISSET